MGGGGQCLELRPGGDSLCQTLGPACCISLSVRNISSLQHSGGELLPAVSYLQQICASLLSYREKSVCYCQIRDLCLTVAVSPCVEIWFFGAESK